MKTVTITELRRNIFRLIDETLETGEPIVLNRKGKRLVLSCVRTSAPDPAETDVEREARWREFWATPSEIKENLTLEEIEAAGEAYWRLSEGPGPASLIHIDTHVVIWLAERRLSALSASARRLAERESLEISPMVLMELETLHESGKLNNDPDRRVSVVERDFGLSRSGARFTQVVASARTFAWTRDPFDRLIVANAIADGTRLLTADTTILANFKDAVW